MSMYQVTEFKSAFVVMEIAPGGGKTILRSLPDEATALAWLQNHVRADDPRQGPQDLSYETPRIWPA